MEKMRMHSMNMVDENVRKLAELFGSSRKVEGRKVEIEKRSM